MKVMLSIKPEFANKIFDGSKTFEFRKAIFKRNVKTVIVYASSPIQKVIGEFNIDDILTDDINSLWLRTQDGSGISKEYFEEYFSEKEEGFAIKIGSVRKYKRPKSLWDDYHLLPPQSFCYVA